MEPKLLHMRDACPIMVDASADGTNNKVLVLCATGKLGKNTCRALNEAGFEVYGTSRNANNQLQSLGIKPIVADYTKRTDLDRSFRESGAKKVVIMTDFFSAAKKDFNLEFEQGKTAIEVSVLMPSVVLLL